MIHVLVEAEKNIKIVVENNTISSIGDISLDYLKNSSKNDYKRIKKYRKAADRILDVLEEDIPV